MSATNSARQRKKKKAGHKHREKTLCCGPLVYEKPSAHNPAAQPIKTTGSATRTTLSAATVHRTETKYISTPVAARRTSTGSHLGRPPLLSTRAVAPPHQATTNRHTKQMAAINFDISGFITYKNQNTHRQLLANARKFPACALQPKLNGSPKRHRTQSHMRQHLKADILGALKTAANRL